MGNLVLLLLGLFGFKIPSIGHLCTVSNTIERLPVAKENKWFWGGLLHFSPVALVLLGLFVLRRSEMRHSEMEIAALLLAAAWGWLGPTLIWYYETVTLPNFARNCRTVIAEPEDYESIEHAVYSNIYDLSFSRYFTPVWILTVTFSFFRAGDFISGFGIRPFPDPLRVLILLGAVLFAFYTSLGFCFCYKAFRLTTMVSSARLDKHIYFIDGVFGLSFIGDFAFTTAAMFFSGWLFAPLVFFSVSQRTLWQYIYSTPVLLLGVLFFFTLLSFVAPIYIIHHKILREKAIRSRAFYEVANSLSKVSEAPVSDEHLKRFDFAKKLIAEVQAIPNWPLRVDTALKFLLTSIFVPGLATLFAAIIKAKAGTP